MEILLSAVLGEMTTRSINFIINKYSKPPVTVMEDSLQRSLLRAQVIVDEAMGRHIRNPAMLLQLNMLRDAMHRGHYVLDTFRYKSHDEEDVQDHAVSRLSSLSKVNSAKRLCFSSKGAQALEELREALDSLSSMILDANELVQFLASYPPMYRQPYSMHLLLDNCMFGRLMEAEFVINFLLHTEPHGSEELKVLPIVGPRKVGKSTLVAHVCKDERVRDHFSEILFLRSLDFTDVDLASYGEGCAMEHQNRVSNPNKERKLLVVVDLVGDHINEDAWNRLYSASKWSMQGGSKIIVTSRSAKITKFGTAQALTLKYLSHEAYWYFFKTLTFGSTDPEMHPRLAHLAMEIARMQNGSLIGAHVTARLLRDNFDINFWCQVLAFLSRFIQKHVSRFGEQPLDLMGQNRHSRLGRMATPEDVVIYHQDQCSSQDEVPRIKIQDLIYGSIKPHGKFQVLAWKSQIPPYHSHFYICEVAEQKTTAAKRKRPMDNGVTAS